MIGLLELSAITFDDDRVAVNLDWPRQSSESELLERLESPLPHRPGTRPWRSCPGCWDETGGAFPGEWQGDYPPSSAFSSATARSWTNPP